MSNGFGGSVGSALEFSSKTLEYTNAQILTLLGSILEFQTILPAPGAGKAIGVLAIICTADKTGGAYTFTGDALLNFFMDGNTITLIGGAFREEVADAYPLFSSGNAEKITASMHGKFSTGGDGSTTDVFENKSLKMAFQSTITGLAGGNAANSLKVTVLYTILDV